MTTIFITFGVSLIIGSIFLFIKRFDSTRLDAAFKGYTIYLVIFIFINYCLIFIALSILKYNAYHFGLIDFTNIAQGIFNTLSGNPLEFTLPEWGVNISRFSMKFEPILLMLSPFLLIWRDPRMLIVLHTIIIGLGVFPLYFLSRDALKSELAAFFIAASYLLYPALEYANLFDMHAETIACSLLLFAIYFLYNKKFFLYWVFVFLSLMCNEFVPLIIFMFGIYLITKKKKHFKTSLASLLIGLAVFIFINLFLIPHLSKGEPLFLLDAGYSQIGGGQGLVAAVKSAIANPQRLVDVFLLNGNLKIIYILFLLLSVGFIPIFELNMLFIALPIFIINLMHPNAAQIVNQHTALLIPFVFFAVVGGIKKISDKLTASLAKLSFINSENLIYSLGMFVFCSSLISNIFIGPSPISLRFWNNIAPDYYKDRYISNQHNKITDKFIKAVPARAFLSVSNHIAPHLALRRFCYPFPLQPQKGSNAFDYILVDFFGQTQNPKISREEINTSLKEIILSGKFSLEKFEDGLFLFKKSDRTKLFYNIRSKPLTKDPDYLLNYVFDERVELIGYDYAKSGFGTLRIVFYWRKLRNFSGDYAIIDVFEKNKLEFYNIHLPSYIIMPMSIWEQNETIREVIEYKLPDGLKDPHLTLKMIKVPKDINIPIAINQKDIEYPQQQEIKGVVQIR